MMDVTIGAVVGALVALFAIIVDNPILFILSAIPPAVVAYNKNLSAIALTFILFVVFWIAATLAAGALIEGRLAAGIFGIFYTPIHLILYAITIIVLRKLRSV